MCKQWEKMNGSGKVSVQFSRSVMSEHLRPHGLHRARPPCPSPTAGAYSNSCLLNWWCHPTISYSVIPFASSLQSIPPSQSFRMSQFFGSGGQSIGASTSASVLLMNIQDWFPSGLTSFIFLQPKDSQEPTTTPQFEGINSSTLSLFSLSSSHIRTWLLEKP